MSKFAQKIVQAFGKPLIATGIETIQINTGRLCNLSCKHCHLKAGPDRTERMSLDIFEKCLALATLPSVKIIDITGGAPEMNHHTKWFIEQVGSLQNKKVLVRSNLTLLTHPDYASFIDLYVRNNIEIIGSLPDISRNRTNKQRGDGSFESIIGAIRLLNGHGYGFDENGLRLHLTHNPVGAYTPGSQAAIEDDYKRRLENEFGIRFNRLFCITNSPIGRFGDALVKAGRLEQYMDDLTQGFDASAAQQVMCKTTLSISYDGTFYDCDFNQALDIPVNHGAPVHIDQFDLSKLTNREICVADHCFACTAGAGSSCTGTLS